MFPLMRLFSLDYYNERRLNELDQIVRPPTSVKTFDDKFRPHDLGRGQEQASYGGFQIPLHEQKILYHRNPWIKKCVDHIADACADLQWNITCHERYADEVKDDLRFKTAQEMATQFFNRVNPLGHDFADIIKMTVRDLKIMDGSLWEIIRDKNGIIHSFRAVPFENIRIDIDEHGRILGYVQDMRGSHVYGMYSSGSAGYDTARANDRKGEQLIYLDKSEAVYHCLNRRTDSPYGGSPVSSLVQSIKADLAGEVNLSEYFSTGGAQLGFLSVGANLDNDNVERIRIKFRKSMSPGMRYDFPIIGSKENMAWNPMQVPNNEGQFAELHLELRNKILAIMDVPPNELGLHAGGRGQVYSQQDVFWGNAVIPTVNAIARKITTEILAVHFDNRLKFEFQPPKEYQYEAKMSRLMTQHKEGWVDDDTIYRELAIRQPATETDVQKQRKLQVIQQEAETEAAIISKNMAMINYKLAQASLEYQLKTPKLQYLQTQAQTKQMVDQADSADEMADIQKQQLAMQAKQLELQIRQIENEEQSSGKQFQLQDLQMQLQMLQMEQQLQAMQGQGPQPVSTTEVIQAIRTGQLDIEGLSQLVEQGRLDQEQLKEIMASVRTISGVEKLDAPEPAGGSFPPSVAKSVGILKSILKNDTLKEQPGPTSGTITAQNTKTPIIKPLGEMIKPLAPLGAVDDKIGAIDPNAKPVGGMTQNLAQKGLDAENKARFNTIDIMETVKHMTGTSAATGSEAVPQKTEKLSPAIPNLGSILNETNNIASSLDQSKRIDETEPERKL